MMQDVNMRSITAERFLVRRVQGQLRDLEGEAGEGDPAQHRVHQRHHPHHRHRHDRRRATLGRGQGGDTAEDSGRRLGARGNRRRRHPVHRETVKVQRSLL